MQSSSLYLNPDTWDLQLDGNGDLQITANPYAIAQDVATACLTFRKECYYNSSLGVPFFQDDNRILGIGELQYYYEEEAKSIKTVAAARCTLVTEGASRAFRGVITVTDNNQEQFQVAI